MTWQDIPGWSRDIEPFYAELAETLPQGATFVEVGVFLGRSLACIGTLRPDLDLWAVDPWADGESQGYQGVGEYANTVNLYGGLFPAFVSLMRMHAGDVFKRVHVVRARSTDVRLRVLADVVFLDGAHDYLSVREDISHWAPVVKPGGLLAGHDYHANYPGVIQAVREHLSLSALKGPGDDSTVWAVRR